MSVLFTIFSVLYVIRVSYDLTLLYLETLRIKFEYVQRLCLYVMALHC